MLSSETEFLICKIFYEINKNEINIENCKKNFCKLKNFEPFIIFKYLDYNNNNFISNFDIINFLQSKSIEINENISNKIINFYDIDNKGYLNYSEFLNFILYDEKILLNNIKNNFIDIKNFNLSYEIENNLVDLFKNEIILIKNLDDLILKLNNRKDFSLFDLFLILKEKNNFINMNKIKNLFNKYNIKYNNEDIKRIFKKIDINKDGFITFDDIEKIFKIDFNNYYNNYNKIKLNNNNFNNNNNNDSYLSESTFSNSNIIKISDNLILRQNPEKKPSININNNSISNSFNFNNNFIIKNNLNSYNEILLQFFNLIIQIEIDIEKLKINLSLQSDFNIENSFKLFNVNNKNFITENDFEIVLNIN